MEFPLPRQILSQLISCVDARVCRLELLVDGVGTHSRARHGMSLLTHCGTGRYYTCFVVKLHYVIVLIHIHIHMHIHIHKS